MNAQRNSPVNAVLIGLVGVLVGFIGGYLYGQSHAPASAALGGAGLQVANQAAACPHSLETKDLDIIAGFRCPGSDDAQVLLADCHCPVSHGIHDLVKAEVAAGKTHAEIRSQLTDQYGAKLSFGTN